MIKAWKETSEQRGNVESWNEKWKLRFYYNESQIHWKQTNWPNEYFD